MGFSILVNHGRICGPPALQRKGCLSGLINKHTQDVVHNAWMWIASMNSNVALYFVLSVFLRYFELMRVEAL